VNTSVFLNPHLYQASTRLGPENLRAGKGSSDVALSILSREGRNEDS